MLKITETKDYELFNAIKFCHFVTSTTDSGKNYSRYMLVDRENPLQTYLVTSDGSRLHRAEIKAFCGLTGGLYHVKQINQNRFDIQFMYKQNYNNIFPNYKECNLPLDFLEGRYIPTDKYNYYSMIANIYRGMNSIHSINYTFLEFLKDDFSEWNIICWDSRHDAIGFKNGNLQALVMPIKMY